MFIELYFHKGITAPSFVPLYFEIILNVFEFLVIESRETKITRLFNAFFTLFTINETLTTKFKTLLV